MNEARNPIVIRLNGWDRRRLSKALAQVRDARFFRRLQAVLLAAQGRKPFEIAEITGLSRRTVYYSLTRYLHLHRAMDAAHDFR